MERITFTPKWLVNEAEPDKSPKFFVKLASILDRDQFDAELDGVHRAAEVPSFRLRDIAIEGLNALLGDEAADLGALVLAQYGGEQLPPDEVARLKTVFDILAEHWPEYRAAREQEARRNRILPTLAFVRWCDGWENLTDKDDAPVDYARDKGAIPDAVLRRISPIVLRAVGVEAYRVQFGQGTAGN